MKKTNFTDRLGRGMSFCAQTVLLFLLPLFTKTADISAQCTIACSSTNIGVDASCTATINIFDVLQLGVLVCPDLAHYKITLKGGMAGPILEAGVLDQPLLVDGLVNNTTTPYAFLGQHLVIEVVVYDANNQVLNTCWNWHLFEDKLPPVITCGALDTIPCYAPVNWANISAEDCTLPVTPHIISQYSTELPCNEEGLLERIIRTYYATDGAGNISDTCTDTVFTERPDLDSINWPAMVTINCEEFAATSYPKDSNGHPSPTATGFPTIGESEIPLWPNAILACNLFTSYNDVLIDLGCDKKYMRTWNVTEWYCGTDYSESRVQIIFVRDTERPSVTAPADVTVNTAVNTCMANFNVPSATATDNCQTNFIWQTQYPGGFRNQNGGFSITLPVGRHKIWYRASDGCVNQGIDSMYVTVQDNTPPSAICIENTVVSLPSTSGLIKVPAEVFDNGSYDNCGPVTFEVARMNADCNGDDDPQTTFRDTLIFYCCDVSPNTSVVVRLKVIDQGGNSTECMVNVKVQDKTPPQIVCPPNITIHCGFNYDLNALASSFGTVRHQGEVRDSIFTTESVDGGAPATTYWGLDGYAFDNCGVTITELTPVININDCGSGTIRRIFRAQDQMGNTTTCTQRITIERNEYYWNLSNFYAPRDTTITNGACNIDNLTPDDLGDLYKPRPKFNTTNHCFNLAYSFSDEVFYSVDGVCFKIIRHWKVIDWCLAAEYGTQYAIDHGLEWHQLIKVMNNRGPIFTPIADLNVCSNDASCDVEDVTVTAIADDDCTPDAQITYRWRLDKFYESGVTPTWDESGVGRTYTGTLPVSTTPHRLCFYATDQCGNVTEECVLINVGNCKKPTPVIHVLVTEIMPSAGMITMKAKWFDRASFSTCGGPLKFSFSSNPNDTTRTFTCDDFLGLPGNSVEIWVTDAWGNQDYVITTLILQDNNNVCDGNNNNNLIAGSILTEQALGVPKIDVSAGSSMSTQTTAEGKFRFTTVQNGNQYQIKPKSELKPLNGVDAGDVIKFQNHILNKVALPTPYKIVAANVNMDGVVDVRDIIEIKKLILGKTNAFSSNLSWRFVDKKYNFVNPTNPLNESFPEFIPITYLTNVNDIDFYGMKLGDVNNSVTLNLNGESSEIRSGAMTIDVEDQLIPAGQPTQVKLQLNQLQDVEAFQIALKTVYGVQITNIEGSDINLSDEDFNMVNRELAKILWTPESANYNTGVITLTVIAEQDVKLSDVLSISDDMSDIAFLTDDSRKNIELNFAGNANDKVIVYQNKPNPFSNETFIGFNLPEKMEVSVRVYDISGKLIKNYTNMYSKGFNELKISAEELNTSGVLFYEVNTKLGSEMRRMIQLK